LYENFIVVGVFWGVLVEILHVVKIGRFVYFCIDGGIAALGYLLALKYPAYGECTIVWFGNNFLNWLWKFITHLSPLPERRDSLSCQLMSAPSSEFYKTNAARPFAQSCQLYPREVGFSWGPKALTKSETFPVVYFCFRFGSLPLSYRILNHRRNIR
jgi:hypothetical protein